MRAASSRSSGIEPAAICRSRKMPKALAAPGTIRACSVPTQPRVDMRMKLGTRERLPGTSIVAISRMNSGLFPGKSNFAKAKAASERSEEHTSELQSRGHLVCRLLLEKKKTKVKQSKDNSRHNKKTERQRLEQ